MPDKRSANERKFGNWQHTASGGRRYWHDVWSRGGWRARYIKEVDAAGNTVSFRQEIYDGSGALIEVHEEFPVDRGHRPREEA